MELKQIVLLCINTIHIFSCFVVQCGVTQTNDQMIYVWPEQAVKSNKNQDLQINYPPQ